MRISTRFPHRKPCEACGLDILAFGSYLENLSSTKRMAILVRHTERFSVIKGHHDLGLVVIYEGLCVKVQSMR